MLALEIYRSASDLGYLLSKKKKIPREVKVLLFVRFKPNLSWHHSLENHTLCEEA
jgi:hypothetical protein